MVRGLFIAIALTLLTSTAQANDSMAEVALGGLVLKESDAISLDREELFISRDEVRVDYRFTNTTDADIKTIVAFPLPDQSYGIEDEAPHDLNSELEFKTTVDGQPADLQVIEKAMLNGIDVTGKLSAVGISPHDPQDWEKFHEIMKALPSAAAKDLVSAGLIETTVADDTSYHRALWSVSTTVTREQVFPARKTIAVSHRYRPVVGGSVGGNLNADYRKEEWQQQHAKDYCIEDSWFVAFDKTLASRATTDNPSPYSEWWLGYVLKSGANWKGPIKDFRLVIDKGNAEHLVSFCGEGVTKISPTQFEIRKKDFEPKDDLKILIVDWVDPHEQEG